jgi:hypothetical protein
MADIFIIKHCYPFFASLYRVEFVYFVWLTWLLFLVLCQFQIAEAFVCLGRPYPSDRTRGPCLSDIALTAKCSQSADIFENPFPGRHHKVKSFVSKFPLSLFLRPSATPVESSAMGFGHLAGFVCPWNERRVNHASWNFAFGLCTFFYIFLNCHSESSTWSSRFNTFTQ